ncbi:glycosyltransferase [Actibacterium sp. 188UL27-1]|uniref:glycosyltransferase n=1 Tax=Actibacterium sp. 188UL27-1 TaxID=2786961 RepID=UPI00195CB6B6|nr:glycosyltransferase [Actibacterium sp. 188UL27-1]MBM7069041.1 glycosyltransferase [Actibacterium sp. 188UL27-1]
MGGNDIASGEISAPCQPTLSIIVTNYNYGHFLKACLASVRAQIQPADQVVVVDDGSTDASLDILADTRDLHLITQGNGGQAAAFNAGFQAATGEIVVFLDADDLLMPHAVKTIKQLWNTGISALSFQLDLVDAAGRSSGHYPMEIPDRDLQQTLLNELTLPFMPTSGNAFCRAAVAWAFPLPTQQWRICADALLIRAAVHRAPIRHIRQTLGQYRIHGHNNYFRTGGQTVAEVHIGLRHASQAGLDLITLCDRSKTRLSTADRAKLLTAAIRTRLSSDAIQYDRASLSQFLSQALRLGAPRTPFRFALCLVFLRITVPRSETLRRWIRDRAKRPVLVQQIFATLVGRRLAEQLYSHVSPRTPFGDIYITDDLAIWQILDGPEWTRDYENNSCDLHHGSGTLIFRRKGPGPAIVRLDVEPPDNRDVLLRVLHNGAPLGEFLLEGRQDVVFRLPAQSGFTLQGDLLTFAVSEVAGHWSASLQSIFRPSVRLTIHDICVASDHGRLVDAVVPVSSTVGPADLKGAIRSVDGAPLVDETLIGPGEALSLAKPALNPPFCLNIQVSERQVPGTLVVLAGDQIVWDGTVGPSGQCQIELLAPQISGPDPIELVFTFRADDFFDNEILHIHRIGWQPGGALDRNHVGLLLAGQRANENTPGGLRRFLGDGWTGPSDHEVIMHGPTAELTLSPSGGSRRVALDLEPCDPLAADCELLIGVTVNDVPQQTVRLASRAVINVSLSGQSPPGEYQIRIGLNAAIRHPDLPSDETLNHGGIILRGLEAPPDHPQYEVRSVPPPRSAGLASLLEKVRSALESIAPACVLEVHRQDFIRTIPGIAPSALPDLLSADSLQILAELGAILPPKTMTDSAEMPERLGQIALAMLCGPAYRTLPDLNILDLSDVGPDYLPVIGSYLVADPGVDIPAEELKLHQGHLVRLLQELRGVIAAYPSNSPLFTMAHTMLSTCKAHRLLFSAIDLKPHVAAYASAVEAWLLSEGHNLHHRRRARPLTAHPMQQRIGILVRRYDPTMLAPLLGALKPSGADIFLYMTEPDTGEAKAPGASLIIDLSNHTTAAAVRQIRKADLDILVIADDCYFYLPLVEIAAHRLAPRQIAMAPYCRSTTGLSATDEMIVGHLCTSPAATVDYTERVLIAPEAGIATDLVPFKVTAAKDAALFRPKVGAQPDDVILVNAVTAKEIGPETVDSWIRILKDLPQAKLVINPFSPGKAHIRAFAALEARIEQACTEAGIPLSQICILPPLSELELEQLWGVADIYLTGIHHADLHTLTDALRHRTPVVALAGQTVRQRQGAGLLTILGLDQMITRSVDGYVRLARELVKDLTKRKDQSGMVTRALNRSRDQEPLQTWLRDNLVGRTGPVTCTAKYVFHHLPKTGGSTVKDVLGTWFDLVEDYRAGWGFQMPPKQDLQALRPDQLLCGHYSVDPLPLSIRYPETTDPEKWRLITFVRDPLSRSLSTYHFERERRKDQDKSYEIQAVGEWLRNAPAGLQRHFECGEDDWEAALDRYWFIGTLERLPECLAYLAYQFGKPAPKIVPHANPTAYAPDQTPNADDIAAFFHNNATDIEIYSGICQRLEMRLTAPRRLS